MPGYDKNFLSVPLDLPKFSSALKPHVVTNDALRDDYYRDLPHITLAVDKRRRQALFVALNIDRDKFEKAHEADWWDDTLIGLTNQLGEDYYTHNRWDRGHLARRESAAWNSDDHTAQEASEMTMVYTNAAPQLDVLNRGTWKKLENWAKAKDRAPNKKVTSFTGPIFGNDPLYFMPKGLSPAEVPAAFFKIICFENRQAELEVRAFMAFQDRDAIQGWRKQRHVNGQVYQTSVKQIEKMTGLKFDKQIGARNPLYFTQTAERLQSTGLTWGKIPEARPVDRIEDVTTDGGTARTPLRDEDIDVFIAAAMPNPDTSSAGVEWVSILNLDSQPVSLDGWELENMTGRKVILSGTVQPGESKQFAGSELRPVTLKNSGDVLTLWRVHDGQRERADRVFYDSKQAKEKGRAILPQRNV